MESPPLTGPLRGIRVVEFGHFIAAPHTTRILADLGAEVIKVEPPDGDPVRGWGLQVDGASPWWSVHGRNKKCVTLNLKAEGAREIALGLVRASDAVVENYRPGLMERFGIGPEDLAAVRPGCVLVRISGFGQTGPRRNDASFGMIGEAIGGIRHLTGYPPEQSPLPPVRTGVSMGDSVAGIYGAVGILAGLLEAQNHPPRPGAPARVVDVALTESVLSLLEGVLPDYGMTGAVRQPTGSRIMSAAPSNAYPTADGAWVLIGGNSDPLFERLCMRMGKPEMLSDPRYKGNQARLANVEPLDAAISDWTRSMTAAECLAALSEANIPSSKIYTAADIAADEQYQARQAVLPVADPAFGREVLHPGPVPRFGGEQPSGVAWPGPAIGAHNDEVYGELLGLSAQDRDDLSQQGVI